MTIWDSSRERDLYGFIQVKLWKLSVTIFLASYRRHPVSSLSTLNCGTIWVVQLHDIFPEIHDSRDWQKGKHVVSFWFGKQLRFEIYAFLEQTKMLIDVENLDMNSLSRTDQTVCTPLVKNKWNTSGGKCLIQEDEWNSYEVHELERTKANHATASHLWKELKRKWQKKKVGGEFAPDVVRKKWGKNRQNIRTFF